MSVCPYIVMSQFFFVKYNLLVWTELNRPYFDIYNRSSPNIHSKGSNNNYSFSLNAIYTAVFAIAMNSSRWNITSLYAYCREHNHESHNYM